MPVAVDAERVPPSVAAGDGRRPLSGRRAAAGCAGRRAAGYRCSTAVPRLDAPSMDEGFGGVGSGARARRRRRGRRVFFAALRQRGPTRRSPSSAGAGDRRQRCSSSSWSGGRCGVGVSRCWACSSGERGVVVLKALRRRRRPARDGLGGPGRRRGGRRSRRRASTPGRGRPPRRHGVRAVAVGGARGRGHRARPRRIGIAPWSPTTTSRAPRAAITPTTGRAERSSPDPCRRRDRHTARRGRVASSVWGPAGAPGGRRWRWPWRPSSPARAAYDPGGRRPLRRRRGPAARHPRRGLRSARRGPAGRGRDARAAVRVACSGRSAST